jgi:hypothetical protein
MGTAKTVGAISVSIDPIPRSKLAEDLREDFMKVNHNIQERWQSPGPHRPTVKQFFELLKFLPLHVEIQAISIHGQRGGLVIEVFHDDAEIVYAFEVGESGALEPTTSERLSE